MNSRECAISDRNETQRKYSELQSRYTDLSDTYHTFQSCTSTRVTEHTHTLQLRELELERVNLLYKELGGKLQESVKEGDKTGRKLEVLLEEYNSAKCDHVNQLNNLTLKLRTLQSELHSCRTGDDGIKDIMSVLGSDMISCNKEHLARKLVELSKNNDVLQESLRSKVSSLEHALARCEELAYQLHHSNQPSGYLVESINKRDGQITKLKQELSRLVGDVDKLRKQNNLLVGDKELLSSDLEKAMKNREKISDLRSIVEKRMSMSEKLQPKPIIFSK